MFNGGTDAAVIPYRVTPWQAQTRVLFDWKRPSELQSVESVATQAQLELLGAVLIFFDLLQQFQLAFRSSTTDLVSLYLSFCCQSKHSCTHILGRSRVTFICMVSHIVVLSSPDATQTELLQALAQPTRLINRSNRRNLHENLPQSSK